MKIKAVVLSGVLLLASLFTACGGHHSTPPPPPPTRAVVQASQGSPMSYATIIVTSEDSSIVNGMADVNGNFTIPSTGVTFPALVKAISVDGSRVYYGWVFDNTQATVPVNPLTSLVVTLGYNGNPAQVTTASQISSGSLTSGEGAAKQIFSTIFVQFGIQQSIEVLSTSVAPNHSGLDLLFDTMSIEFDPAGNPTICSKMSNVCKVLNLQSLDTTPIQLSANDTAVLNSVQPLFAPCSTMINNLSVTSLSTNASLYSSSFLNNGRTGAQYMAQAAGPFTGSTVSFNTPTYAGTDSNGNHLFQFFAFSTTYNTYLATITLPMNVENGNCVFEGNKLPFTLSARSTVWNQVRVDGAGTPQNTTSGPVAGLYFQASSGLGTPMYGTTAVASVSFQYGSGTPVVMTLDSTRNAFYLANHVVPIVKYSDLGIMSAAQFYNGNANPVKVVLLDSNQQPLATFNLKASGGYTSDPSLLVAANLPALTSPGDLLSQSSVTSGTVNYTVPNGFVASNLYLFSQEPTDLQVGIGGQTILSTTSGSIPGYTISSSATYRALMYDSYTSGGLIGVTTKYVYAPNCPDCL